MLTKYCTYSNLIRSSHAVCSATSNTQLLTHRLNALPNRPRPQRNTFLMIGLYELFSHPFLSVGVFEVVTALGIPSLSDAKEQFRPESIFTHDDEVGEETSARLDHTDLTVGNTDQPTKHKKRSTIPTMQCNRAFI